MTDAPKTPRKDCLKFIVVTATPSILQLATVAKINLIQGQNKVVSDRSQVQDDHGSWRKVLAGGNGVWPGQHCP